MLETSDLETLASSFVDMVLKRDWSTSVKDFSDSETELIRRVLSATECDCERLIPGETYVTVDNKKVLLNPYCRLVVICDGEVDRFATVWLGYTILRIVNARWSIFREEDRRKVVYETMERIVPNT